MRRWVKVSALLGLVAGAVVMVAGCTSCAWTEGEGGSRLLSSLSDRLRSAYINYVLSPGEGIFRNRCTKHNVLVYVGNELEAGRDVPFERAYLVGYVLNPRDRGEGGLGLISFDIINTIRDDGLNRELESAGRLDPDLATFLTFQRSAYRSYGFRWTYGESR